jgi:hypothetical protein
VREILGRDRHILALRLSLRESLRRADGPAADRNHRLQIREDLDDPRARDELDEVEPVGADVADGAQLAAALGLQPRVPVRRAQ